MRAWSWPEMMLPEQKLEPFMLQPGTWVGPWKVKAYAGGGAYGLVFRAVRAGQEQASEVALKVACYPGDERFQREVLLLSRVDHPACLGCWMLESGSRPEAKPIRTW